MNELAMYFFECNYDEITRGDKLWILTMATLTALGGFLILSIM